MCGIVGYIGPRPTTDVLIQGLRKLEYRGYDSAGISVFADRKIQTIKSKGRLADLEKKIKSGIWQQGNIGIGHTRWATHGEPNDVNAHPHGTSKLMLVHNGIIENYLSLKEKLQKKGYSFDSETDTEVMAKLIDFYYLGDPLEAIYDAISKVRGSYALGIMFADYPDRLYAVRKDSPLIVGLSDDENFIASDIPAILEYTKRYYLLDTNEVAVVKKDGVTVYSPDRTVIQKNELIANWDTEAAEKGGYDHFMIKEIHEQPKALSDTIMPRISSGIPVFENVSDDDLKSVKRLWIVGCGTAYHAGLMGKYAIEKLAKIPVICDIASEYRYRSPLFADGDMVITITQSGETADSLAAQRLSKENGVRTMAVSNVLGSSIPREADDVIYTWAGPEIAVASTKAYSVQLSVMYMLAIKLALLNQQIDMETAKALTSELTKVDDIVKIVLKMDRHIKETAEKYKDCEDLFFIGRGVDYALAQEGSLKLKEISYIHSEAYAAGELKHGTISLITEGVPVIALATDPKLFEKTGSNIKEVKARGAKVICLHTEDFEEAHKISDDEFVIPKMNPLFTPLPGVCVLQLFAYYMACARGCDVDKPRNLAKSVTVE